MKQKTYFSTIAFLIFFPPTEFFKNWYIRIRLILVVTKNVKKIHRPEAEILAHEVGKYEKVAVDEIPLYACAQFFTLAKQPASIRTYSL